MEEVARFCANSYVAIMQYLENLLGMTYGELCVLIWGLLCPLSVILPQSFLCYKKRTKFEIGFLIFMLIVYAIIIWWLWRLPMNWDAHNVWDNMNLWLIELSASHLGGIRSYAYGIFWGVTGVIFPIACWIYYYIRIRNCYRK